jgi:hypothetical protein
MHDPDASCRGNAEAFLVVIADRESLTSHVVAVPRESGVSSTPRPLGSAPVSGILGHPLEPVIGRRFAPTRSWGDDAFRGTRSPILTIFWHCGAR